MKHPFDQEAVNAASNALAVDDGCDPETYYQYGSQEPILNRDVFVPKVEMVLQSAWDSMVRRGKVDSGTYALYFLVNKEPTL